MNKEIIIYAKPQEVEIAILEDKELVELHHEIDEKEFSLGDFYIGKVKRINASLNGAFVDIGHEKDAFLHYTDLGPQILSLQKFLQDVKSGKHVSLETFQLLPDTDKHGKISDVLQVNQEILVQITKEPYLSKGPTITTELSLPGRYIVLIPFSNRISVSQKIQSKVEKNRLIKIASSIQPSNFGIIVRTAAEGKLLDEIKTDLDETLAKWKNLVNKFKTLSPPAKVMSEISPSLAIIRDIANASFSGIYVDNANYYKKITDYLSHVSAELVPIVKLYTGKKPIFEHFGVDKQIKTLFGQKVHIKSGAYLIIEKTEALHVIDVNSGFKNDQKKNLEDIAIETNLDAAKEIARQIKLRDMGGIIIIDFIDMKDKNNQKLLYQTLKKEMQKDRAIHTILPPTKFGLVQITRQRLRPEKNIAVSEKCPACQGTGYISNQVAILRMLEDRIQYLRYEQNEKKLTIKASPILHAYLTKGFPSLRLKWMLKYRIFLSIKCSKQYDLLEYHFFDRKGNKIYF
ncbi:MAG: Rne/Rng family ribonuclease [Bacteroidales bacterium]|nr:Rne/Rng family ribonuclease [Bacteroidales bacterium]